MRFYKDAGGITLDDGENEHLMDFAGAQEYRKKVFTKAMRIEGPFEVSTSEGALTCQDGYLCLDARGYPYPVAKDEFDLIYEPAS